MSSAIVFPKDFKTSNVTISPLKVMESGAKLAFINYDSAALKMQVSAIPIPYGMSIFDKAGPVKYSVDLSLKGYEVEGSKMKTVYDAFTALDEYMIEMGVKNSKTWFKSELNREVVKAFYTPIVRFSKDAEGNPKPYPPTVKIQLKQRDGKFDIYIVDDKKRPLTDIPLEDILVKGAIITSIIQCTGIWFAGSKYGLSWKANQMVMDKVPESIRGYAFVDDEEGDIVDDAAFTAPVPAPAPAAAPAPASVTAAVMPQEDDLDLDDAPEDAEPIPLPKKVVTAPLVKPSITKKVVAKK